jgi:site-specific recombinase XerD
MWPEADQSLWTRARRSDYLLEDGGLGRYWSDPTAAKYMRDYGRWLAWLLQAEPECLDLGPVDRFTKLRVKRYVDHLEEKLAPYSVSCMLRGLGSVAWAFSEGNDYYWITRYANRLASDAMSVRNKRQMLKRSHDLVSLGMALMAGATEARSEFKAAIAYRNGLIIALLAYRPIRRGNITNIIIGQHLLRCKDGYNLQFAEHETKQRKQLEVPIPNALTNAIETYLSNYRPVLMHRPPHAGSAGDALWVAADGGPLSHHGIYKAVRDETHIAFGAAINPHLFRDCAATTIAMDDPGQIAIVAHVLGHSNMETSARHYNQASTLDASRCIQAHLKEIRRSPSGAFK